MLAGGPVRSWAAWSGETCQSAFAGDEPLLRHVRTRVRSPQTNGSQRRSCAGGGSHVRQLGRRPSAPLDMVDCLAATRSW